MVNYKNEYKYYKDKYLKLKKASELLFIVGRSSSGKSTVAKKFEKDGYYLISLDDVVKDKLIPLMMNDLKKYHGGNIHYMFKIYRDKDYDHVIDKGRKEFVKILKKMINQQHKKGNKVVVEGSISNYDMIRQIFGQDDDFLLIYVKPKSANAFIQRVKKRFSTDPDNYGRLGWLRNSDTDGKALKDFKKNGINGPIIKPLIEDLAQRAYDGAKEWYDHYNKEFVVHVYLN